MKSFFVRGLSRSGGTLMATILDAHPDVSMSYETYEHLLVAENQKGSDIQAVIEELQKVTTVLFKSKKVAVNKICDANLRKFTSRAMRSGIEPEKLVELFVQHHDEGVGLEDFRSRMLFVERLTREKCKKEGKRYWGAKIGSTYQMLAELYPEAVFLFMLRDGRDIAASRKAMGDFKQSVENIALGWKHQTQKFIQFAENSGMKARLVHYEKLVTEPVKELGELMEFAGLSWSDRLMSFHDLELSIHKNPVGHLSGKQMKNPISTASIGRWKTELTKREVAAFEDVAGDMLSRFNYNLETIDNY